MLELDTPHGQANAHLHPAEEARAALVLGHGAAGGVTARDLVAVTNAAREVGVSVVLVEQPYRVAGRRSPAPARQLDAAWTAVVDQLLAGELHGLPLIAGGRSSGARVACRTAAATGAVGVLCLAFPLQPPRRAAPGAESSPRARGGDGPDARRARLARRVRDATRRPAAHSGAGRGRPQLEDGSRAVAAAVRDWLPSSWVRVGPMDWKLELVAVPVSDVDRAKSLLHRQGRLQCRPRPRVSDEIRFVQLTPPGSACSIALGEGIVEAPPGSAQGLQLVVVGHRGGSRRARRAWGRGQRRPGVPLGLVRLLQRPRRQRLGRAADTRPATSPRASLKPGRVPATIET